MSFSNSESDDDLEIIEEHNHVTQAKELVYSHDEINLENALLLNKTMQAQLLELKSKLHSMLRDCQKKYKKNEQVLQKLHKQTHMQQSFNQQTYYFCGSPYFKSKEAFSAQPTADYQERKRHRELFPADLLEQQGYWLPRDKINLIQGVKKQVLRYLYSMNRMRMNEIKLGGESSKERTLLWEDNATLDEQRLVSLMTRIGENDNLDIDWFTISARDLDGRHTPNECKGMWYGYLKPSLKRTPWAPEEEDRLLCIANAYSLQNWSAIANQVGSSRSAYQCFVHHQTALAERNMVKNVRWSVEEDRILMQLVEKYRIGNIIPWTKIAERIPGRYKAQLYNRYMFSLNPQINHSKFTVEEDCIIMAAIKEYGTNFQIFPQNLLPGRSLVQIRNRYNNVLKLVKQRDHWSFEHDQKLVELVEKHGTSNWVAIAKDIESHSRVSCRSRYNTIAKYLQKHPSCTLIDVPRRRREFSTSVTADNWMETIIKQKQGNYVDESNKTDDDDECEEEEEPEIEESEESREQRLNLMVSSELGVQYYEYFKYSFNFQFGRQHNWGSSLENYKLLKIICQILQGNHIDIYGNLKNPVFSDFTQINKKEMILMVTDFFRHDSDQQFYFPPNLRSILALRGMSIMFECPETMAMDKLEKTIENHNKISDRFHKTQRPTDENSLLEPLSPETHLEVFKKRFFSLFRNSALLSRIQLPNASEELSSSAKPKTKQKNVKGKKAKKEIESPTKPADKSPCGTRNRRESIAPSPEKPAVVLPTPSHIINHLEIEPVPFPASIVEISSSDAHVVETDYYETINEVEIHTEPSDEQYHYTLQTESGTFEIRLYDQAESAYTDNEPYNVEYLDEAIDLTLPTSQEVKMPPTKTNSRKRNNAIDNSASKKKRSRK